MSKALPPQRIISNTLTVFLRERIKEMKKTLTDNNITQTNSILHQSIELKDTTIKGNEYTAGIIMEDYYVFIDQGVKGIGDAIMPFVTTPKNKGAKAAKAAKAVKAIKAKEEKIIGAKNKETLKKASGEYQFKTPFVNRKMVDSIREWGSRKPRAGVTKANMNSVAYLTAKKVKRVGIEQTMFFTDATTPEKLAKLEQDLAKNLGDNFIKIITG
jgi:hypothetical protein